MAYATEVDAMVEAESRKTPCRKGDCRIVGFSEKDLAEEVKKLWKDLAKTNDELRNAQRRMKKQGERSSQEEGCYGCGDKDRFIRKESMQGNESRWLDRQWI